MKNRLGVFLEKYLGAWLIKLLCFSCRIQQVGVPSQQEECVYAFWHNCLLPLSYVHRHEDKVALVSASEDGQLIAGPLQALGFRTVRGSSGRGGVEALKNLLQTKGSLVLAVDGPKGPRYHCKSGVFYLAQRRKLPLVAVRVSFSSFWQIGSWDLLRVPKPFSKIKIEYAPGRAVTSKKSWEQIKKELEFNLGQQESIESDI